MIEPVTSEQLQKLVCSECHDAKATCPIVLGPSCHKGSPVFAIFHKDKNAIEILCSECKEPIVAISIPRMN